MWEEAAIAAGSSLVLFVPFAAQAAMRVGRFDRFPAALRQVFAPSEAASGRTRHRLSWIGPAIFAVISQSPVLAVAAYRGEALDLVSRLLLAGELVAAFAWVLLLQRWARSSGAR